jgi:hypothetical protein
MVVFNIKTVVLIRKGGFFIGKSGFLMEIVGF